MANSASQVVDSEDAKNIAVVHKTNQGYSGKDLWKLKQERPELFGAQAVDETPDGERAIPSGYEVDARLGADWLYSREKDTYLHRPTLKRYVLDRTTNQLIGLGEGIDMTSRLSVRGDAAAYAGADGSASKHVIINDLHKASAAMKLSFTHHDSPAAMFAVYDSQDSTAAVVQAIAQGLHVRLLPRLAAYRGQWQNERLESVIEEAMMDLRTELGAKAPMRAAIALMMGGRLILSSIGGALCLLFGKNGVDGGMDELDVVSNGQDLVTHCVVLEESHLGVLLTVDSLRKAGLSPARLRALVRSHAQADRPRAACLNVLGEARRSGAQLPLVACAVRLKWTSQGDDDGHVAKRARVEAPLKLLAKVRCRHILLRHTAATSVIDRGKPKVARTVGEAEEALLRALPELSLGGPAAFTAWCKKDSDCESKLRGGDLAGDLGWLDRDPAKNRKVPAPLVRAAFSLAVGQLSDIVSTERGVHLLLRTA